jgi:hypothetical protein
MKTLSRTSTVVVLAAIVVAAVLTFRAFAKSPTPQPDADQKFALKFGTEAEYVEVKSKGDFDAALKHLSDHGGQYDVRFKPDHGNVIDHYQPVSIKTDKVTTSEVAKNAPAGESAPNDPHVTRQVKSNSPTDIENVLKTFKQ